MEPAAILFWLAIQSGIGALIGRWRGRQLFGWIMGLVFGPIGWIITAIMSDRRPKCPECQGTIVQGARKCKSCGSLLAVS